MKKLRVGIIGLGVGEKHLEAYRANKFCEVVRLCDFSIEKQKTVGRRYPSIEITQNADDILFDSDIDVVSIASYDNYHYEHIIKAIANNKHVFIEKPLCLYKKEAINIRKHLEKKPYLRLSSNLILRNSARFQRVKEMVERNNFGKLYYIESDYNYGRLSKITQGWRGKIDFYSVIYGGGVHIVDLLLWITQDQVLEVMGYGNKIATKGTSFKQNDLSINLLKFKSGMIAKIACNFGCVFPHFHNLIIYGTKATFINEFEYGRLITSCDRHDKEKRIDAPYNYGHKGGLINDFIHAILKRREPRVGKEDIFRVMSVCFAMEEASQTKKRIKVEYV